MSGVAYLGIAICLEVCGTISLKLSKGFSDGMWTTSAYVCYGFCFWALANALKSLEVSTVYAIWAGVGTALIAAIGIVVFDEGISAVKVASLLLIIVGVIGLQLNSGMHG